MDGSQVRETNERSALATLRDQGSMSRADLARRLGLTRSTITNVTDGLIERSLVREAETPRGSPAPGAGREVGRPGRDIALDPKGGTFVGAEIGVGVLRFVTLDWALEERDRRQVDLDPDKAPAEVLDRVAAYVSETGGLGDLAPVTSVGLTVPGLLRNDGHVVSLPIVGWTDLALGPLAEARLNLPVRVDNNANAAAFGEVYAHPEATGRPTLYLKIGTGVGGAVLLGGRPATGAHGMAAELGHIKVPGPQLPCSCGGIGCLEPRINLQAFAAAARAVEPAFDGRPQSFATVTTRAPEAAAAMIEDFLAPLVSALATLCHVFDPAAIVLGGPLRPVLGDALPLLQRRLAEHLMRRFTPPELRVSRQGEYECAVGAAMLCHDAALAMSGRASPMPSALRRLAS